jgi:AraC-like DNA-binding protein
MANAISRLGGAFLASPLGRSYPAHAHPALEFNFVLRGSARYVAGTRRYELLPGSLLWLFPGQQHAMVQQSPDLQLWLGFFHKPVLQQARLSGSERILLERDPPGHHCRVLGEEARRQLRQLLDLVSRSLDDEVGLAAGLSHLAVMAWRHFERAPSPTEVGDVHPAVSRAARLIAEDQAATLTQVASRTGVSASRLRHLFHEQTGSTLVSYRNHQRLHRFLASHAQHRSLLEQSLAAGFGSYAQFHRVFRALMGVSPQSWSRGQP